MDRHCSVQEAREELRRFHLNESIALPRSIGLRRDNTRTLNGAGLSDSFDAREKNMSGFAFMTGGRGKPARDRDMQGIDGQTLSRERKISKVVFVSTNLSWGGSEELWSKAAKNIAKRGISVGASINIPKSHDRIRELAASGIDIHQNLSAPSLWSRIVTKLHKNSSPERRLGKYLSGNSISLVVISDGLGLLRAPDVIDLCVRKRIPFATVSQLNGEIFWPNDETARRLKTGLSAAKRCYFVSRANRSLFERQIGAELPNAEVVFNPANLVSSDPPPWPSSAEGELRLASVARLEPLMKGQDLLLEALSQPQWRERNWRLTLYGDGPMRHCVEYLISHFKLEKRVKVAGHVSNVQDIWSENHVLVMPSRYEGMPLAMIEAMMCGRPVVATDVAGHREIIVEDITGFLAEATTVSSVGAALERLWSRRNDLRAIGAAGASHIRTLIPSDPVHVFAEKIIELGCQAA